MVKNKIFFSNMTNLLMMKAFRETLHSRVFIALLIRPAPLWDFKLWAYEPEMYICEPRQHVELYDFDKSTNLSDKFKKTLHTFEDAGKEDSFFAAILFGLLTKLSDSGDFTEAFAAKILGREFAKNFCVKRKICSSITVLRVFLTNVT